MKACRKRSASDARFLNLLQISQLARGAGFATCRFRQNDLTRWGIVSKSLDRENKNGRPVEERPSGVRLGVNSRSETHS